MLLKKFNHLKVSNSYLQEKKIQIELKDLSKMNKLILNVQNVGI